MGKNCTKAEGADKAYCLGSASFYTISTPANMSI